MKESNEQFNRQLNISLQDEITYARWKEYRTGISGMISLAARTGGDTVLFGPGNLYDIEIAKLMNLGNRLLLADIDIETVAKSLDRLGCDPEKIRLEKADFGYIDGIGIDMKLDNYFKSKNFSGAAAYLEKTEPVVHIPFLQERFDNILLSSFYTQLFIPWFIKKIGKWDLSGNIKSRLLEAALAFTAKLIKKTNDSILSMANNGAVVCAWSDILEYPADDSVLTDLKSRLDNNDMMDEFYASYQKAYGHGLGSYGIYDISKRLAETAERWFLWPFNANRVMLVKFVSGIIYH